MATSEVDVVNMALGHLGDRATVSSIDPPEQSFQAEMAARYYPIARDAALAGHSWSFNTRRAALARYEEPPPFGWRFAFALPADCLHVLAVSADGIEHDLLPIFQPAPPPQRPPLKPTSGNASGFYTVETDALGRQIVYADDDPVVARYRARVINVNTFTPEFVQALSWLLAHHLAGPLIKGTAGMQVSRECLNNYALLVGAARARDANASRRPTIEVPPGIRARW